MEPNMTLGRLIDVLDRADPSLPVKYDFCGLAPGTVRSWRGDYSQLAIGWEADPRKTVAELKASLIQAMRHPLEGYKGGHYLMKPSTPLWCDRWGECTNTMIVGAEATEFEVILCTARAD